MWQFSISLALVAQLTDPARRVETARELAHQLGAETLLIFVPDAELDVLLPAPGFPQTLPSGREWHAFLTLCRASGQHVGLVPFPTPDTDVSAYGISRGDTVLVLLGGQPQLEATARIAELLPLLAAAFREEQAARIAASQARFARQSAAEARALVTALDDVRRQLQQALDRQEALQRTREEFMMSMTHDLKTPITSIKLAAQMLTRRMGRSSDGGDRSALAGLDMIGVAANKMAAMIDQLLDLARAQDGEGLALERRPVDLLPLVRRIVAIHQAEAAHHSVGVTAAAPSVVGHWDEARIERVVDNLVGNAIKYSPAGGAVQVVVDERYGETGPQAVMEIRDSGLGIPAADRAHIFERFYRAANVVGHISGTGIGLAGAKQIIELHGGTIGIESEEGRGTTVTVCLPLSDDRTLAPAHPSEAKTSR